MPIVRWDLKEAGCGEHTNPRANLWSDGQKSHIRLYMGVSLRDKIKPDSYTEPGAVNAADRWREGNVWVYAPLRSVQNKRPLDVLHPREVCAERSERSNRYCEMTLNAQKSAEAIVAGSSSTAKDRINRSL